MNRLSHKHDNEPHPDKGVYASNSYAEANIGHDALRLDEIDLLAAHWNFPTRICPGPIASRGNREIVPAESTKVN
jgi:hypothetical protein